MLKELKNFFSTHEHKLIDHYPGLSLKRLVNDFQYLYQTDDVNFYAPDLEEYLNKILQGIPLEQIFHNSFFYNYNFFINEDVLIPRSETEILVEKAVSYINKNWKEGFRLFEIGVGPGTMALTIAAETKKPLLLDAGDICPKALNVARINSQRLLYTRHPKCQINFLECDRMALATGKYDLIVSNPPYIKNKVGREGVHAQVLKYEPHLALFLEDEIYDAWFSDLLHQVSGFLDPNGAFLMEGHEDCLDDLLILGRKCFADGQILLDYNQRKRFIFFKK